MVDELRLTEVLHRAGDGFEVPDDAFERILAAAGESGLTTEPRPVLSRLPRRHRLLGVAAGVALLLTGVAVVQNGGPGVSRDTATSPGDGYNAPATGSTDRGGLAEAPTVVRGEPLNSTSGSGVGGGAPGAKPGVPVTPQAGGGPAKDAALIIRTGTAALEVDEGEFAATMAALTRLAGAVNGYVAATTTSESDDRPSGSITLRVPGDRFDRVVADIRGLGDVVSLSSSAADVSAEYTDLESRLRALTATRSQFVTLLSKATKVGEILEVQTRINDVQVQIEQIQGRKRLLDDQTSFGSLKVEVYESGDVFAIRGPESQSRFGRAWDDSVDGFLSGLASIVAAAGPTLLIVLCLLALWVAARVGYRLLRRRLV